jgi:hypothetical protein
MVTDRKVRRLREVMNTAGAKGAAAAKAARDEKTARKYIRFGKLPSEMKEENPSRQSA